MCAGHVSENPLYERSALPRAMGNDMELYKSHSNPIEKCPGTPGSLWEWYGIISYHPCNIYYGEYTAVSTKVVPQKRKSVRNNADWYYG